MQTLTIAGSVTPGNWSSVALAASLSVGGIVVADHVSVAGASKVEVDLVALTDKDDVEFVLITAESYPETAPGTPDLGYHVHADTETEIPLSMFHMYTQGMLYALDTAGLVMDKIFITNGNAADINLRIYIGYTP